MNLFDAIKQAVTPPGPTADQKAQAQAAIAMQSQATQLVAAAQVQKPACLETAAYNTAQSLCAQKRTVGQEAVAAFGALLGTEYPYAKAIAAAPCDWALLPLCPSTSTSSGTTTAIPSLTVPTLTLPPIATTVQTSASMSTGPTPTTPPPPPKSDTMLIVGGVALGAIVLGGLYVVLRKKREA